MQLKANFHFHTSEDKRHRISYSLREGIDYASTLGFEVLAPTCHQKAIWTPEHAEYAASKNILLIPGIELYMREQEKDTPKHVLLLNALQETESMRTFNELEKYKKTHPEIFIIASHPYFYGNFSVKNLLEKHINLFDGIEHSWFYSKMFNRNKKGEEIAKKYNLPFIATSDTHFFKHMDKDYMVIEADEKTPQAIFAALKQHKFQNVTSPKKFFRGMVIPFLLFELRDFLKKYY